MKNKTKKRKGKHMPRTVKTDKAPVQELEEQVEEKQEWHHVATVEELEGLERKIHVTFDTVAVQLAFDKATKHVGERVNLKGFRRGKAPKAMVEVFCKKEIEEAASSMLAQEGYLHACYENKFHALTDPKIEESKFDIDGTFSCDIMLEIKPSITPTGYVGIHLEKDNIDREKIVENYLSEARKQHSTEISAEEIEDGSIATVSYIVQAGEEQVASGEDQRITIRASQEPPFGSNLIGKKVGDTLEEITVLPEQLTLHGGKEADVKITINSVSKVVPPTDEELSERMRAPSFEEIINVLNARAEQEAASRERQMLEEAAVDKILELHEFDVPKNWVADEEKYLLGQLNMPEPDPKFMEHISKMAERNVRRTFILDAIYDAEPSLKVQQEEFEQLLEHEAELKGISKLNLKKKLQQEGMLDAVFGILKHRKVMDLIFSQATISVKGEAPVANNTGSCEIPENPLG